MSLENIKYESISVDKKQIILVRFDFEYPMDEANISQITQTVSNILNTDRRFINRVIFLPKGFELDVLNEDDFIEIWKSKVNDEDVEKIINEDENPNQLSLFKEGVIDE
tara:strand:- start:29 stop:355 length:327 start_codon:yes stop_codon:yes gene_type:complete